MDTLPNEKGLENLGQINISFGLLKKYLNLKDNIEIIDIYTIKNRQNVVSLVLKGEGLSTKIAIADIRPVYKIEELKKEG